MAYDYERVTPALKESTDFVSYFEQAFQRRREQTRGDERSVYRPLADAMGLNQTTLRKIFRLGQRTQKRDLIIAVCAQLGLNARDTNAALLLYPMAALNPKSPRDLVITVALNDRQDYRHIDEFLAATGHMELNVSGHAVKYEHYELSCPTGRYRILGTEVEPVLRKSSSPWSPESYDMKARMELLDEETGKHLEITEDTPLPSDDPVLAQMICGLRCKVDAAAERLLGILDDTRNYGSRVSARYSGEGSLLFFAEAFDQKSPEQSLYHQLQLCDGKYTYTQSHESLFLQTILSDDEYRRFYGTPRAVKATPCPFDPEHPDRVCREMMADIEKLRKRLQKGAALDPSISTLTADEVVAHFRLEARFRLHANPPKDQFIPRQDGLGTPITVDDIRRAAELRIPSYEEILKVRMKHGGIEGILE